MTWEDYFESDGPYLAEHPNYFSPERLVKEVSFLIDRVPLRKKDAILDLACGQARHTIALTEQGYYAVGVDRSNYLLSLGSAEAAQKNISVRLVEQDMLSLDLGQQFNIVLVLFAAFGIEDDKLNEKILGNISRHLKSGGKIFLEIHNLFRLVNQLSSKPHPGFEFDLQTLTLWEKDTHGLSMPYRYYTIPELVKMFDRFDIDLKETWGDYSGSPYGLNSERLLVLGQKR